MPRRIDLGRALLALGAALLLASLFVDWYDNGLTGWEVFDTLDLVLLGFAVAGVVLALRPQALGRERNSLEGLVVPVAVLVVVVVQLLGPPPAAAGTSPSTGAWLAFGASLLMLAGAVLLLARISVIVEVGERRIRHRTPAVDRRAPDDVAPAVAADPDAPDVDVDPDATERTQPLHVIEDEEPDRP